AINEVTRDPMTPMTNTPMLTIQHQAGSAPEPIAAISPDAMMPMTPMMVATKKTICDALSSDHQAWFCRVIATSVIAESRVSDSSAVLLFSASAASFWHARGIFDTYLVITSWAMSRTC